MTVDVEKLYVSHGPLVLRRCRQLLGDEERAVDAMQDTFVKLLQNAKHLDNNAPGGLLYRMATNTCLNIIRSQKRKPETADSEIVSRIASLQMPEDRFEAAGVLGALFSRNKTSTRTMAVLHFLDKMTLEEVAVETGMSVSGVRKRLRPLKQQLSDLLAEEA